MSESHNKTRKDSKEKEKADMEGNLKSNSGQHEQIIQENKVKVDNLNEERNEEEQIISMVSDLNILKENENFTIFNSVPMNLAQHATEEEINDVDGILSTNMLGDDENERPSTKDDYQDDYEEALSYLGKFTKTFPVKNNIKEFDNQNLHIKVEQNPHGNDAKDSLEKIVGKDELRPNKNADTEIRTSYHLTKAEPNINQLQELEPQLRTEFHKDEPNIWPKNFQSHQIKFNNFHKNEIFEENEKESGFTLFNSDWFTDKTGQEFERHPRVFDSPFFQESSFYFKPFKIPDQFRGFKKHSPIWF